MGPSSPRFAWQSVCAGDSGFVAVGGTLIISSPDGLAWSYYEDLTDGELLAVAYGAGGYVAVAWAAQGGGGYFLTSTDGADWEEVRPFYKTPINASIAYGAGRFVVFGNDGDFYYSDDGLTWHGGDTGTGHYVLPVFFLNNQFWANQPNFGRLTSPNGLDWTFHAGPDIYPRDVTYGNGVYLSVSVTGSHPLMWSSRDGLDWTEEIIGVRGLASAIYAFDSFIVGGTLIQSQPSFVPEINRVFLDGPQLNAEVFGQIGREYALEYSTDLKIWRHQEDYGQTNRVQPLALPIGSGQKFFRVKLK
jgi:hypothetical protein